MSSEQNTFDRLRRVSYNIACAEYTVKCMELAVPINLTIDEIALILDPFMIEFGWTVAELSAVNHTYME